MNIEALNTFSNGRCYVITSDFQLDETFASIFGLFITLKVPNDEFQTTLNGILGVKNDYNLLHYKPWPGTKPFSFEVKIGDMMVLSMTKQIWNYYPYTNNRKCKKYEEPNEGFVQCWSKKLTQNLKTHQVCYFDIFFS